jgi:non-heme chloroperoxidase
MSTHSYAEPLAGTEKYIARPDGTKLRTVSVGSGERTAVLAHGYGFAADEWNLIAPKLVAEGFGVVAFDQRGHGGSSIGSDGAGSAQMASDYGAVLETYELNDAILVGHSMGGFLAIAFLLGETEARSRVGRLLLMATFAGDVSRKNPQNRLQIPLIKSGILQRLLGFGPVAKAFTKSLVGDGFEPEMADAFMASFLDADHEDLVPILSAMVYENRYGRLGELDLPCTIVIGTKDKTTPPFHTADLHTGITGSKLVSLPGMGHALNWEAPDAIVNEIVELAGAT